jgi:hypothetical protein
MICFDVLKNGAKVATAGLGDYGVMTAIIDWVGHSPHTIAKWQAEGGKDIPPVELRFHVGGLRLNEAKVHEHLKWFEEELKPGDEVVIRILDQASADAPREVKAEDPDFKTKHEKAYVRRKAKEFGWDIQEP